MQDGTPARTTRSTQAFLSCHSLYFWSKEMWLPYSPDLNPLDYAMWPHIEAKVCKVRHFNVEAMRTAVNNEWADMDTSYVRRTCMVLRKRLEAVIAVDGGYFENYNKKKKVRQML